MSYSEYNMYGGFLIKEWRNEEGHLHREDGPAYIRIALHNKNQFAEYESYRCHGHTNGSIHRIDGPARIWYDSNGLVTREEFWISHECLGSDKEGFFVFWDLLSEEEKQNNNVLKLLIKYTSS